MEAFYKKYKCPIGRMVNIWGERLGLEEWAVREAAEGYFAAFGPGDPAPAPIDISWDVLSRAEAKCPISQRENNRKSDPELRTEINRLRGVIANLREAIADLSADKENMWLKMEALTIRADRTEVEVRELRKDNLAFSGEIEALGADTADKFEAVGAEIEKVRLANELDKLETESKDLKSDVKGKRRFWQRSKNE